MAGFQIEFHWGPFVAASESETCLSVQGAYLTTVGEISIARHDDENDVVFELSFVQDRDSLYAGGTEIAPSNDLVMICEQTDEASVLFCQNQYFPCVPSIAMESEIDDVDLAMRFGNHWHRLWDVAVPYAFVH